MKSIGCGKKINPLRNLNKTARYNWTLAKKKKKNPHVVLKLILKLHFYRRLCVVNQDCPKKTRVAADVFNKQ